MTDLRQLFPGPAYGADDSSFQGSRSTDAPPPTPGRLLVTALLAVLVSLNLSACERIGGPDADGAGAAATLVVEPDSAAIGVGDDFNFDARVVDRSGSELPGYAYSWSISDPSAASVDSDGTVTGRATANVQVSVEASTSTGEGAPLSNAAPVEVLPGQVAGLSVSPASPTIELGDTIQLVATVTGENGEELDRTIQWASSDTSVARTDAGGLLIGEGDGTTRVLAQVSDASDTADVSVDATPAASVEVTPDSMAIGEGETTRLDATVYNSSGDELDRTVSWSSSNTSVVTVDPLGQIQAQLEGEAAVTAQSGEASDTVNLEVISTASTPAPVLVEDFSSYESTAAMLDDPRGIYQEATDINEHLITLDETEGVPQLGTSQSMRYDYDPDGWTGDWGGTINRNVELPNDLDEVWIEVWAKFSTNFDIVWGKAGNPDFKWIFAHYYNGRHDLHHGVHESRQYGFSSPDYNTGETASDEWDGEWHRYRIHWKNESSDGTCDGTAEFWVDDDKISDHVGTWCSGGRPMDWIELGKNHNQIPSELIQLWWGQIKIWESDPGW